MFLTLDGSSLRSCSDARDQGSWLSKHVGTTLLIAGWGCSNAHAMENVRMLAIGTGEMSSNVRRHVTTEKCLQLWANMLSCIYICLTDYWPLARFQWIRVYVRVPVWARVCECVQNSLKLGPRRGSVLRMLIDPRLCRIHRLYRSTLWPIRLAVLKAVPKWLFTSLHLYKKSRKRERSAQNSESETVFELRRKLVKWRRPTHTPTLFPLFSKSSWRIPENANKSFPQKQSSNRIQKSSDHSSATSELQITARRQSTLCVQCVQWSDVDRADVWRWSTDDLRLTLQWSGVDSTEAGPESYRISHRHSLWSVTVQTGRYNSVLFLYPECCELCTDVKDWHNSVSTIKTLRDL